MVTRADAQNTVDNLQRDISNQQERIANITTEVNNAKAEYRRQQARAAELQQRASQAQPGTPEAIALANEANDALNQAQSILNNSISFQENRLGEAQQELASLQQNLQTAQTTLSNLPPDKPVEESVTNKSESDKATEEKYANPSNVPDTTQTFDDGSSIQTFDDGSTLIKEADGRVGATDTSGRRIPAGAERKKTTSVSAEWAGAKDLRVTIRVPTDYLNGPAAGPSGILKEFGGILFPYTPNITYDTQASYSAVNPTHSNYTQYFYKSSSVSSIGITGKFTVQNEKEGAIWLGIVHLARALTKMRFGSDANAGSPPPVCRLEGYGDYMLRNVPVVISSFKFDLPDDVDYIAVKDNTYKTTLVPTRSFLNFSLNVLYSRNEIRNFSVDKWLSGNLKGAGYL